MMELTVEKPLRRYESIIIVHPDATEEEQKQLFQKNAGIVKSFNGEVIQLTKLEWELTFILISKLRLTVLKS